MKALIGFTITGFLLMVISFKTLFGQILVNDSSFVNQLIDKVEEIENFQTVFQKKKYN